MELQLVLDLFIRTSAQEILQKTLITSYISIDGGLRPLPETLMAVAKSFASYTSVRWDGQGVLPWRCWI